jgi:hypothetical protein
MAGRRIFQLVAPLAGAVLGATAGAVGAAAQCCAPPPPCCAPPPPPPPSGPCCGGPRVVVPGVNVSVQSTAIAVSGASARAGAGAQAGGSVFVGGGGSWYVEQPAPTVIQNLNVEAEAVAAARVAVRTERRTTRRVLVQAVCLDDRAVPHPASQVRPGREVEDDYEGEVWRCVAGTRLQATLADWRGEERVDGGETIGCDKLQALWHAPGGALECRAQKPARDCNERSLLRRYGAGLKLMTLARIETVTDYREDTAAAAARAAAGGSLMLDGGVGGVR